MKKRQIKSFDGSFPSETSLSFLILAHVLRHTNKNTYLQTMFAATQQIASIAGLKATKVQVRALSSSSSSQYSFSGKDLVAFGARARVSL